MRWHVSNRADPRARVVADRHYNRQKVGAPQFVPPGRCLVLLTETAEALWISSWPIAAYVQHAWAGAWMCTAFRREPECEARASDLIREACAATRARWGEPPPLGMVTFVDPSKVKHKRDPGRCFRRAGFRPPPCVECGGTGRTMDVAQFVLGVRLQACVKCEGTGEARTQGGLVVLQLLPEDFPPPEWALGSQPPLLIGCG